MICIILNGPDEHSFLYLNLYVVDPLFQTHQFFYVFTSGGYLAILCRSALLIRLP
jgi:hypothetical protein